MSLFARTKDTQERIIGTAESLLATAYLNLNEIYRKDDGSLGFEYTGENEIHWDTQETQTKDGKVIFVTESGREVTEDQIELVEED